MGFVGVVEDSVDFRFALTVACAGVHKGKDGQGRRRRARAACMSRKFGDYFFVSEE